MSDGTSAASAEETPVPSAGIPELPEKELVYQVRDLTRGYSLPSGAYLPVLQGVDLDVRQGELLVIQGRSGIGKSTLLHLLGLLDRPSGGSIRFEGRAVESASLSSRAAIRARRIGFVFQFFYLLPEFTALENVMIPGTIAHGIWTWMRGRSRARERARELLETVGLGERLGHLPNQLSGGERQRVALARALFMRPAVLLCDEPTGNLDVRTSEAIHDLLARLNAETRQTMVVVTHDEALARHATRVVHIENGRAVS